MNIRFSLILIAVLGLSGCATVDIHKSVATTNQELKDFTQGELTLFETTEKDNEKHQRLKEILAKPLSQQAAVSLLLINSPSMQNMLANHWQAQTEAAQSGRISNPVLAFERVTAGDELEISRILSFGLLDLITYTVRQEQAKWRLQQAQTKLAADVVQQISKVQQAWIDAVVAKEKLRYAKKVAIAAEASAELAQRMQTVGNFTRSQAIRHQLFYSNAVLNLATSKNHFIESREKLIRLLGLEASQAQSLQLPDSLPSLPKTALRSEDVVDSAKSRLDLRLATQYYNALLASNGINKVYSYMDIEASVIREYKANHDSRESARGYELELRLPIFDWGELTRDSQKAQLISAANNLQHVMLAASSHLRQSYHNYRTNYDIAKHYQNEVIPMMERLAEEDSYKYNGMFISTFQLVQESANRIKNYENAIQAKANFWKASIDLQANLIGQPMNTALAELGASSLAAGGDDH